MAGERADAKREQYIVKRQAHRSRGPPGMLRCPPAGGAEVQPGAVYVVVGMVRGEIISCMGVLVI